jgi:hypothetical protein
MKKLPRCSGRAGLMNAASAWLSINEIRAARQERNHASSCEFRFRCEFGGELN